MQQPSTNNIYHGSGGEEARKVAETYFGIHAVLHAGFIDTSFTIEDLLNQISRMSAKKQPTANWCFEMIDKIKELSNRIKKTFDLSTSINKICEEAWIQQQLDEANKTIICSSDEEGTTITESSSAGNNDGDIPMVTIASSANNNTIEAGLLSANNNEDVCMTTVSSLVNSTEVVHTTTVSSSSADTNENVHKDIILPSSTNNNEDVHKDIVPSSTNNNEGVHKDIVPSSTNNNEDVHKDIVPSSTNNNEGVHKDIVLSSTNNNEGVHTTTKSAETEGSIEAYKRSKRLEVLQRAEEKAEKVSELVGSVCNIVIAFLGGVVGTSIAPLLGTLIGSTLGYVLGNTVYNLVKNRIICELTIWYGKKELMKVEESLFKKRDALHSRETDTESESTWCKFEAEMFEEIVRAKSKGDTRGILLSSLVSGILESIVNAVVFLITGGLSEIPQTAILALEVIGPIVSTTIGNLVETHVSHRATIEFAQEPIKNLTIELDKNLHPELELPPAQSEHP
jgi:hypothetical protein